MQEVEEDAGIPIFEKLDFDQVSSIHGEDRTMSWFFDFVAADDGSDKSLYKRKPVVMLAILSILLLGVGVGLGIGIAVYFAPHSADPVPPPTVAEA